MDARSDPFVGVPVLAATNFRVRWDGRAYPAGLPGMVATVIAWVVSRMRSRLPAYSYVAVTSEELHILEIRYGGSPSVQRRIGSWPLASLRATRLGPWSVRLKLTNREVELESTDYSEEAARLITIVVTGVP